MELVSAAEGCAKLWEGLVTRLLFNQRLWSLGTPPAIQAAHTFLLRLLLASRLCCPHATLIGGAGGSSTALYPTASTGLPQAGERLSCCVSCVLFINLSSKNLFVFFKKQFLILYVEIGSEPRFLKVFLILFFLLSFCRRLYFLSRSVWVAFWTPPLSSTPTS